MEINILMYFYHNDTIFDVFYIVSYIKMYRTVFMVENDRYIFKLIRGWTFILFDGWVKWKRTMEEYGFQFWRKISAASPK